MAIAAAAAPPASSFCAMRPPNEWPITIGLAGCRLRNLGPTGPS
jgi:hypothetical protein